MQIIGQTYKIKIGVAHAVHCVLAMKETLALMAQKTGKNQRKSTLTQITISRECPPQFNTPSDACSYVEWLAGTR